jgi:hypothetical protein
MAPSVLLGRIPRKWPPIVLERKDVGRYWGHTVRDFTATRANWGVAKLFECP